MATSLRSILMLVIIGLVGIPSFLTVVADDAPKKDEAPKKDVADKKDAAPADAATPAKSDAAEQQKWQAMFDGKTMDGWAITEFGTGGEIVVEKGHILIGYGDGCTGVNWTKDFPKVDYEVRIEAQRVDGTDFFCGLTFPVKDSPCSLIVGGWGGALVGLSSIDGEDASSNATKLYMTFKNKQWYEIRLRVTKTHISAWIDGKRVIHQATEGHKLSIRPEVQKSLPFGICSWCTTSAIRKADLRILTKEEAAVEAKE
jgi:hypothetical protein